MSEDTLSLPRRTVLKTSGVAVAVGLAGCTGGGDDGGDGGDDGGSEGDSEVEVVHWWTAGGEEDAIEALIEGFEEEYSDFSINNNPAPGGAGSALSTEIQDRVLQDDAPSTFQIWPGGALETYTDSDVLADISDSVWTSEMEDAYKEGVRDLSRDADGNYVAVPLNIHRLNNLFYNVDVVDEAGVDPTTLDSPSALLDAMETIDAETDAAPMAQSTKGAWTTLQLWEDILVGEAGVDTYESVLENGVAEHEDAVRSALQTIVDYEEYFNDDSGSVAWDQANNDIISGDAAFMHQGDWAAGQYESSEDFEFEEQWDHVPFPGTEGVYHIVTDSFVKPEPNPSPDATDAWLSYVGSVDGQERFNPIKGSIPARTDVPDDEFGAFLTRQREDFDASDSQPATIAHGTGVSPGVKSDVEEAFASFNGEWDVDRTYSDLTDAI